MRIDRDAAAPRAPAGAPGNPHTKALVVLTSLFFMWGLITSLNDILIPHLKGAFALTYVQAMLVQLCFFGAYFAMSFPSGWLVERVGYQRGIVFGLFIAACGCALFHPAAGTHRYGFFLAALFVLASGITLLQVAANPYVAILGPPATASSRLTLTQAFNSVGTTIGPYVGAQLILGSASLAGDATSVQGPYLGLAAALLVIAAIVAASRLPDVAGEGAGSPGPSGDTTPHPARRPGVWHYRHLVLGAVAIFAYVGAEVSIGSLLVNAMGRPEIAGLPTAVAGEYLSLYWGGAMVGRFVGSVLLTRLAPGRVLACNAAIAALLLVLAMAVAGHVAMWVLLAIGLCNSIMFPTIFTLAIRGLGDHTGEGSGVLCMAIVGGAIVPVLQGAFADHLGVLASFVVPVACYLYIVHYGVNGHRVDAE